MTETKSAASETEVSRDRLAELLNEDLSREYQAIISYVVYSQVLKGAEYMGIAAQLEIHAKQELDHALTLSRQIDYLESAGNSVTYHQAGVDYIARECLKRLADLLAPLGWAYGALGAARRAATRPERVGVPTICVGTLTAGGAGKTPVVLSLAALLRAQGRHPHILSRGYGGSLAGPLQVDREHHTAREVGD